MITINTHNINDAQRIGEVILNNPESLNAFAPPDAVALTQILAEWRSDDSIVAVILRGAGAKAFCAGGDVRRMPRLHCCR